MFFSAGIVLLTLLINGTTTGFVIRMLDLARENQMTKLMLHKVLEKHEYYCNKYITEWKKERSENGDKAGNMLYDEVLDLDKLKAERAILINYLKLEEIYKHAKPESDEPLPNNTSVNIV